eukprot:m.62931 g.62931  ORF g.62931 m.62931 type:complete len:514 (+) comp13394_c1_seq2:432-1973(+)
MAVSRDAASDGRGGESQTNDAKDAELPNPKHPSLPIPTSLPHHRATERRAVSETKPTTATATATSRPRSPPCYSQTALGNPSSAPASPITHPLRRGHNNPSDSSSGAPAASHSRPRAATVPAPHHTPHRTQQPCQDNLGQHQHQHPDSVSHLRPASATMVFGLDELDVQEQVGKGFFGTVSVAVLRSAARSSLPQSLQSPPAGPKVVVKELRRNDADAHQGFAREIALLQCLSHPHVLKFLGVTLERLMLVTEYAQGGMLRDPLLNTAHLTCLPWTTRHTIARQVADACHYIHSRNIVHRDIKDTNVLLREALDAKGATPFAIICDFGCARVLNPEPSGVNPPSPMPARSNTTNASRSKSRGSYARSSSTCGNTCNGTCGDTCSGACSPSPPRRRPSNPRPLTVVGSVDWMAPEVVLHQPYNEMVDVFSFGCLLLELVLRMDPDPDQIRLPNFGLDEEKCRALADSRKSLAAVAGDWDHAFNLAMECGRPCPQDRPTFDQILSRLGPCDDGAD